jgi:hypothetical protein
MLIDFLQPIAPILLSFRLLMLRAALLSDVAGFHLFSFRTFRLKHRLLTAPPSLTKLATIHLCPFQSSNALVRSFLRLLVDRVLSPIERSHHEEFQSEHFSLWHVLGEEFDRSESRLGAFVQLQGIEHENSRNRFLRTLWKAKLPLIQVKKSRAIADFSLFHNKQHPKEMGAVEVEACLTSFRSRPNGFG